MPKTLCPVAQHQYAGQGGGAQRRHHPDSLRHLRYPRPRLRRATASSTTPTRRWPASASPSAPRPAAWSGRLPPPELFPGDGRGRPGCSATPSPFTPKRSPPWSPPRRPWRQQVCQRRGHYADGDRRHRIAFGLRAAAQPGQRRGHQGSPSPSSPACPTWRCSIPPSTRPCRPTPTSTARSLRTLQAGRHPSLRLPRHLPPLRLAQGRRGLAASPGELEIVSCHLGIGASLCAIDHGRSVDTSMA